VCVYIRDSSWPLQSNTLELDRPQRNCSAASQFSSTTIVSPRCYFKRNSSASFSKMLLFRFISYYKKCLSPKLRNGEIAEVFDFLYVCICMHVCMNTCMYVCMDGWMGVYLFMWLQRTVCLVSWKTNSVQLSPQTVNECNKEWRACFRIIFFYFRYWSIWPSGEKLTFGPWQKHVIFSTFTMESFTTSELQWGFSVIIAGRFRRTNFVRLAHLI